MRKSILAVSILTFCGIAIAATTSTFSVPYMFTSGTRASASEINSNFQSLATAINNINNRIDKLEGKNITVADIAGTYTWTGLQVGLGVSTTSSIQSNIETVLFNGTIVLVSDGTFNLNVTNDTTTLNKVDNSSTSQGDLLTHYFTNNTLQSGATGTWSVIGNTITISSPSFSKSIILTGTSGNRILVGSVSAIGNASTINQTTDKHLVILSKNN